MNEGEFYDKTDGVVSLETVGENANFDIGYQFSQDSSQKKYIYDNVEIEDISSDEVVDNM